MRYSAGVIFLILCLLVTCPALALINITPVSVGESYIVWEWNPGLDLTDMYIDGNVMCGYNTTDNMYVIAGLHPVEEHNITVYTATDMGANTTFTLNGTSNPKAYQLQDTPVHPAIPIVAITLAGIALASRRKDNLLYI